MREYAAICRRFLQEEEDVRDALHDAYITIFTTVDRFTYRGAGSLSAWMRRIVVNQCITILRRRKTNFVVPLEELSAADRASVEAETEPTAPNFSDVPLQRLIAELPTGYRTILNLFAIEGLSHKEIADTLGITASTSASQYLRAKRLLAKRITLYISHDS